VIAPPSRHVERTTYYWVVGPGAEPSEAPAALVDLIAGPEPPTSHNTHQGGRIGHPDRYASVALAAEADRVARAPVGTRNDTLNRAAFALGRLVGAGLLDPALVTDELTAAARWAGLGRVEAGRTIRSGLTAGRRQPLDLGRRSVA
jgi:hypothetical protein